MIEPLLFFLILGGLITTFFCDYKKNPTIAILIAIGISILLCVIMNDNSTTSGVYIYYVNGQRIGSGVITVLSSFVMFVFLSAGIIGLFVGLNAINSYGKKENLSFWKEFTHLPPVSNLHNRLSASLICAIFLWLLGFGLINMLFLGRGRAWIVRSIVLLVLFIILGKTYIYITTDIFIPPLFTILYISIIWVYDIIDCIILKLRYNKIYVKK